MLRVKVVKLNEFSTYSAERMCIDNQLILHTKLVKLFVTIELLITPSCKVKLV